MAMGKPLPGAMLPFLHIRFPPMPIIRNPWLTN
jgi:hypothetical protein